MDVPVRAAGRSLLALMHDAALRFGTHRRGYSPCSMRRTLAGYARRQLRL
jgi:hypothetical protein